jgi:HK97 family phage prohead protease
MKNTFEKAQGDQRRFTSAELRATSDFKVGGIAAAYNTKSSDLGGFVEQIAPGAFANSLRQNADVKALVNHDPNLILGRTKNGTLTLSDSPEGLRWECQLDKTNPAHASAYASIKRGDLDSCSFAFTVPENGDEWDFSCKPAQRTLRNVSLQDVSAVCYPAYPQGTAVGARKKPDYVANTDELRRAKVAEIGEVIAADSVALRIHEAGVVVAADKRAMSVSEVSGLEDWLSSRIGSALAAKPGNGWSLVAHSCDENGPYCLAYPSILDDDLEDNAFPPVGRFNYQIDPNTGEVLLGAYSRYVYAMGPDGPIMPGNENSRQLSGPKFRALVEQLRLDSDTRRKMRSSAGIFVR